MTRSDAWNLLREFTQSESLRKHALAVEACMRAYARKLHGDEEQWGIVGLIHDFDYEKYPSAEEHPYKGNEILEERGYPEEMRRAIMSHADYTGVSREDIINGAAGLGIDLDEHIAFCIEAMKNVAGELGLAGK